MDLFWRGIAATMALTAVVNLKTVSAQSVPSSLPGGWTLVGCYTDISTSRTLKGASIVSTNLTVESCISFCANTNFIYAGAEFGNCDSTIQYPSQPTPLLDCNFACAGNATETCGAGNRLNIFLNTAVPPPKFVQSVNATDVGGKVVGVWNYTGCYTDNVNDRTLSNRVAIPGGVTAETCTAACRASGQYTYAGLENGVECWCGNQLNGDAQHVSDADCRMVCGADHREYCGNANRLQTYTFRAPGNTGGSGTGGCVQTALTNFTMVARQSDGTVQPLKVVVAELTQAVVWGVLSACPTCCSEYPYFSMQNSVIFPHSPLNPALSNFPPSSSAPGDGETPNFVGSNPAFVGVPAYCTVHDTTNLGSSSSPNLLAFGGRWDAWSLCANMTAGGRLDLVWSPVSGHPHYTVGDCKGVVVEVISG